MKLPPEKENVVKKAIVRVPYNMYINVYVNLFLYIYAHICMHMKNLYKR